MPTRMHTGALLYNASVHRRRYLSFMAILLIVAVAVIGPTFYAGYRNIGMASAAAAAGNYAEAERFYESAAHQLPWREDLLEYAGVSAFRAADLEGAIRLLEAARR